MAGETPTRVRRTPNPESRGDQMENLIIMPSMEPPDLPRTREAKEIKQIATLGSGEIVALCSDSTVWIYAGSSWQKLPELPKEADKPIPRAGE